MYKLVLLDADGTLFDFDKAERYALKQAFVDHNIDNNKNVLERYQEINLKLWAELEEGTISKESLKTERFKRLFTEFEIEVSAANFSSYYLDRLGEGSQLIDGAEEICRYLSKKYTLIMVTNGIKEVQFSRLAGSPIKDYFEGVVVSEEVGANKPDSLIFEYALNIVNHDEKENVIIIGDSLTSDILGGINFGIDTCWINLAGVENRTDIKPTYEIRTLHELKTIL